MHPDFLFPRDRAALCAPALPLQQGAVKDVFDLLEERLGDALDFQIVFQAVLTDRGGEFGDPAALETPLDGHVRTAIYYCDPMRSGQKGGIESVHAMLRYVAPDEVTLTPKLLKL